MSTKKIFSEDDSGHTGKRSLGRQSLLKQFWCELLDIDIGVKYKIRIIDVSPRGVGFLCSSSLSIGKRLKLVIDSHTYDLEVVHSQPHLGIENLFRCGAFSRDPDANLQETVIDFLEKSNEDS